MRLRVYREKEEPRDFLVLKDGWNYRVSRRLDKSSCYGFGRTYDWQPDMFGECVRIPLNRLSERFRRLILTI